MNYPDDYSTNVGWNYFSVSSRPACSEFSGAFTGMTSHNGSPFFRRWFQAKRIVSVRVLTVTFTTRTSAVSKKHTSRKRWPPSCLGEKVSQNARMKKNSAQPLAVVIVRCESREAGQASFFRWINATTFGRTAVNPSNVAVQRTPNPTGSWLRRNWLALHAPATDITSQISCWQMPPQKLPRMLSFLGFAEPVSAVCGRLCGATSVGERGEKAAWTAVRAACSQLLQRIAGIAPDRRYVLVGPRLRHPIPSLVLCRPWMTRKAAFGLGGSLPLSAHWQARKLLRNHLGDGPSPDHFGYP